MESGGTVIDSYSYTYDAAHNMRSKVDVKGTTSYIYDNLNRLQTVNEPSGVSTTYEYDTAGNRASETKVVNGTTTYTLYEYDNLNRLMRLNTSGGTNTCITYSYDNNGNMLSETEGGNTISYMFDAFNQMKERTAPGSSMKAMYDGNGLRVEKETNGVRTRFLYEGDQITLELSESGNELARNVYGSNLIQRKSAGQTYKYLYNGQADVTALIDTAGGIAAKYYYDDFGNLVEETGNNTNPYKYRGYEQDKETSHYYLKSRYYDPKIGRFLSEDTYKGSILDPLSLNLYTYCHNEPIMYVDPDGHYNAIGAGSYDPDASIENISSSNPIVGREPVDQDLRGRVTSTYNITSYQVTGNTAVEKGKVVDINRTTIETIELKVTNTATETSVASVSKGYDTGRVNTIVNVSVPVNISEAAVMVIAKPTNVFSSTTANSLEGHNHTVTVITNTQNPYKSVAPQINSFVVKGSDNGAVKFIKEAGSTILGAVPIVGDAKDIIEALAGKDTITHESLSTADRVLSMLGAVLPVVSGKALRSGRKALHAAEKELLGDTAVKTVEKNTGNHVTQDIIKQFSSTTKGASKTEDLTRTHAEK